MATRLQIRIALLAVATLAILASFAFAAVRSDAKPRDAVRMRTFARGATASATKLSVVAQSPASGATVAGSVAWEVKASSRRLPGRLRRRRRRQGLGLTRSLRLRRLDTTKLGNGRHTLTATAYAKGSRPASATIGVTVANATTQAPTPTSAPNPSPTSAPEPTPTAVPTPNPLRLPCQPRKRPQLRARLRPPPPRSTGAAGSAAS